MPDATPHDNSEDPALRAAPRLLKANAGNVRRARRFALARWQERARSLDRVHVPEDLSGACKFCALFAQELFGGELKANWFHVWVSLDGQVLDLTDAEGVSAEQAYLAEGTPWFRPWHVFHAPYYEDAFYLEHCEQELQESLDSCRPLAHEWVQAFRAESVPALTAQASPRPLSASR